MKPRTEHRRAKLPPLLDIDEDGPPMEELERWKRPRWSSDPEDPEIELGDWPAELDD